MSQMKGYLAIEFNKNGKIEGAPRVGKIGPVDVKTMLEFWSYEHEISIPSDKESGHSLGRRIHQAITIQIEVRNPGAVLLCNAACTNDKFKEGTFNFFDTNEKGESYLVYTVKISDGTVNKIRTVLPNVHERHEQKEVPLFHEVSFTYASIEGTNSFKKTFRDDWKLLQ